MNKKALLPILWAALSWLPYSCSSDTGPEAVPDAAKAKLTVDAARDFFETAVLTRSGGEPAGGLTLGSFEPDWESAQPSEGWDLEAVDVPVRSDYIYRISVGRDSLGRELGLRITHRLIVLRQKTTEALCPYLLFYVPDSTYAAARPLQTAELCETLLSCAEKASFTGLALYTRTDGTPIAAQRYDEGLAGAGAFLFDERYSDSENLERLRTLVGSIKLWRCSQTFTRGVGDINLIEPVPIYGQRPIPIIVIDIPPTPAVNEGVTEFTPLFPESGGGPGGTSGADVNGNTKFHANPNLRTKDPAVLKLLDKFMEDCMGRTLIENLNYTIEIEKGTQNSFSNKTVFPKITLMQNPEKQNIHDIILLEELLHAYQYQLKGWDLYACEMNCEIEAKLGWYMYRLRNGNADGLEKQLGGNYSQSFKRMAAVFRANAINTEIGLQIFEDGYFQAYSDLRNIKSYRNISFSSDIDVNYLYELLKDC